MYLSSTITAQSFGSQITVSAPATFGAGGLGGENNHQKQYSCADHLSHILNSIRIFRVPQMFRAAVPWEFLCRRCEAKHKPALCGYACSRGPASGIVVAVSKHGISNCELRAALPELIRHSKFYWLM